MIRVAVERLSDMSEISDRFRKVAGAFAERARAVPREAWDNPAPCDGWIARDIVSHMVEWMPSVVIEPAGLERPQVPPVDDGPAAAWDAFSAAVQSLLDDPEISQREFETRPGRMTFEGAVDYFVMGDVLMHTWDLARATGQDDTLDADEVHRLYQAMLPLDELLRASGHYGPKVDVPDDADEQTKLVAFTGRQP